MSLGKLPTFAAALMITSSESFAGAQICPNLSDIQEIGITMATQFAYNYYVGYTLNNYHTSFSWGFAIGLVEADSNEEAIDITNEILSKMTGFGIPEKSDNELVCLYEAGDPNFFAVAIKDDIGLSPLKFKQYMTKYSKIH